MTERVRQTRSQLVVRLRRRLQQASDDETRGRGVTRGRAGGRDPGRATCRDRPPAAQGGGLSSS
jgi:hypothetical protein